MPVGAPSRQNLALARIACERRAESGRIMAAMMDAAAFLAEARAAERAGQLFRAYDLAMRGLAQHPGDILLQHRAVLSLARAGATTLARQRFEGFGLGAASAIEDVAALGARLLKDTALASPAPERAARAAEAASSYRAIYRQTGGTYPAINAATLTLLAGDEREAASLAAEILALLGPDGDHDYYQAATRMEALLLLGDLAGAVGIARATRALADGDQAALATTWKQLRLVLAAKRLDSTVMEAAFAPAPVIHFLGHMISWRFAAADEAAVRERIERYLDHHPVGAGFGSLAAGGDILIAEALLDRGIGVSVVLPFEQAEFIDLSVRPSGPAWVARFESCLARAATVRFATEDRYLGDDGLFAYCSRLAMGLACLQAQHLGAGVTQLAIWDGRPASGPAGTAADVTTWREAGLSQTILSPGPGSAPPPAASTPQRIAEGRQVRAMLFCDIKGFSRLTDAELLHYVDGMLAAIGLVVDRYRDLFSFGNTWGDGLFLVFDDPASAAACALDLQDAVADLDLAALGLPPHLAMRIGGHLGPVYAAYDPILRTTNYFGAHVSRAARIEPVTPEGCVYVTEPFAAALALPGDTGLACDYVGVTESAKHYGAMRMFLLHRTGAS
jgi:hypothetical protein